MRNETVAACAAGLFLCLTISIRAQEPTLDGRAVLRARKYEALLVEAARRHGIDSRLLWVIAYLETRFDPGLISPRGARGLMQLMPATAARFGAHDPHHPVQAIDAAARYLRYLTGRFCGRTDLALAAYNAGEGTVEAYLTGRTIRVGRKIINSGQRRTGGVPPYRETQKYVADGLAILMNLGHAINGITRTQPSKRKIAGQEPSVSWRRNRRRHFNPVLAQQPNSQLSIPSRRLSIAYQNR